MKIALRITIDIDPDEWVAEYGVAKENVRDSVRRYVQSALFGMEVTPESVEVR